MLLCCRFPSLRAKKRPAQLRIRDFRATHERPPPREGGAAEESIRPRPRPRSRPRALRLRRGCAGLLSSLRRTTQPTLDCVDSIAAAGVVFTFFRFFFCVFFLYRLDLGPSAFVYLRGERSLYVVVFGLLSGFLAAEPCLYALLGWSGRRRLAWPATLWLLSAPFLHVSGAVLVLLVAHLLVMTAQGDARACVRLFGPFPESFSGESESAAAVTRYARWHGEALMDRFGRGVTEEEHRTFDLTERCAFHSLSARREEERLGSSWRRERNRETGQMMEKLSPDREFDHLHETDRAFAVAVAEIVHIAWLLVFVGFWVQIKRYFTAITLQGRRRPKAEAALARFLDDRLSKEDVQANYTSPSSASASSGEEEDGRCASCVGETQVLHRWRRKGRTKEGTKTGELSGDGGGGREIVSFRGRPQWCKKEV